MDCCWSDLRCAFHVRDGAQAGLDFVVDVLRHQNHFLDDLLLVIKFGEAVLQLFVELLEFVESLFLGGDLGRLLPARVFFVHLLVELADFLDQLAQRLQMAVAALDFFVHDHAVKPFLGRLGNQFFRQRDVFLGGKTEAVNDPLLLVLGFLDALADRDFLLAREQRHLAHLPQIHPHRIVENIQPALFLFLLRLGLLDAVHLGLVHDLNFQVGELGVNLVQVFRRHHALRQRVIDVVVGQVSLFLGQEQQLADLFRQIHAGLGLDRAGVQAGIGGEFRRGWGSGRAIAIIMTVTMGGSVGFGIRLDFGLFN